MSSVTPNTPSTPTPDPTPNPAPTPTPKKTTPKQETPNAQPSIPGISQRVIDELSDEINNMLSFAIYNGITVNTEVNALIQNSNVDDLINAHNLLCKNVAPATPKSILYAKRLYKTESKKTLFNKLPLLRNLMLLAVFFLVAFIGTGMTEEVNNASLDQGIMGSSGWSLLLNLSYLGSVAGLGVLFYLLKDVSTSLKNGTLVPEDAISYMSQILLGVIAGLIISEILSPYVVDPETKTAMFNKSVLALIGGFSSDAIFSILQGVINKVKGIFITTPNQQ